jgi:hypothetical protein
MAARAVFSRLACRRISKDSYGQKQEAGPQSCSTSAWNVSKIFHGYPLKLSAKWLKGKITPIGEIFRAIANQGGSGKKSVAIAVLEPGKKGSSC